MFAWWLMIPAPVRKMILWVILALVVLSVSYLCILRYGARQWSNGEQQGRISATTEIEKAKALEWKQREALLQAQEKQNISDHKSNVLERRDLEKLRTTLELSVDASMQDIQNKLKEDYEKIRNLRGDMLDDAIRAFLSGYKSSAVGK